MFRPERNKNCYLKLFLDPLLYSRSGKPVVPDSLLKFHPEKNTNDHLNFPQKPLLFPCLEE
uniref:Uncharacterized protein n=1 Tax=Meloidogyne enterolobii TaxID=390850 RepID=A0A6V7XSC2_MELEN|nr:unnamed protein product [Meloidogyne enterolobii]